MAESKPRAMAERRVILAAQTWWSRQRPIGWSYQEHLQTPAINCVSDAERALARSVASLAEVLDG